MLEFDLSETVGHNHPGSMPTEGRHVIPGEISANAINPLDIGRHYHRLTQAKLTGAALLAFVGSISIAACEPQRSRTGEGSNPNPTEIAGIQPPDISTTPQQEKLSRQEIDPNAVQIIYDQSSRATTAVENGHILRIIPPPVSQNRELDIDQGFKIEVFWQTLAGTPKPSRPFVYVITTAEGERVDGYVRSVPQASMKQEETSPQPAPSPSDVDPKSLRIIFIRDIGSIIAIGPDGRLVRAIHLLPSYSRQAEPTVNVSVWRNTTGGKIIGEPVGARLTTNDGASMTSHIEKVPQLKVAITLTP